MKFIEFAYCLGMIFLSTPAWPSESTHQWPPIPTTTWDRKNFDLEGFRGVLVIKESMLVDTEKVTHELRFRITSDQGKDGIELPPILDPVAKVQGRTILRDGRQIPFESEKDTLKKFLDLGIFGRHEVTRLIPPGMTSDCIVDLRWSEKKEFDQDMFNTFQIWLFDRNVPVTELDIKIHKRHPWSSRVMWNSSHPPEIVEEKYYRRFTFKNLPAYLKEPFEDDHERQWPRLILYPCPLALSSLLASPRAFWSLVGNQEWISNTEDVKTGPEFNKFKNEITKNLPIEPQAMANELAERIHQKIKVLGHLSAEEKVNLKHEDETKPPKHNDFELITKKKLATEHGIFSLFFYLLQDQTIELSIALISTRNRPFNYEIPHLAYPFRRFVVIEEKGKLPLIMDPGLRFAAPGLILEQYQEGAGILIKPLQNSNNESTKMETGSVNHLTEKSKLDHPIRVTIFPTQPAVFNQSFYKFDIRYGEGKGKFDLQAEFGGFPEYLLRYKLLPLPSDSQITHLSESYGKGDLGIVVDKVKIQNVMDTGKNVHFTVSGTVDLEDPIREIQPFPGMPKTLVVPKDWPRKRNSPIRLPIASMLRAVSRMHLNPGDTWSAPPKLDKRNSFGQVLWHAEGASEHEVNISMAVIVNKTTAPASRYEELTEFLGWIQQCSSAKVRIQSVRGLP